MKIRVSEASRLQLDWMVAQALGHKWRNTEQGAQFSPAGTHCWQWWRPTTDWAQGGALIERELLAPEPLLDTNCALIKWRCRNWKGDGSDFYGPTPLVAAMRCLVASKLGDEVEVPSEMLT